MISCTIAVYFMLMATIYGAQQPEKGCVPHRGDIRKLTPTGASRETAQQDNLGITGVPASQKMVESDIDYLNKLKDCYCRVGRKYGLSPSLIAALASRESRGGRLLMATNGWGDGGKAYGILQCDVATSGLGQECTKHPWNSCEHIDMMIGRVFMDKLRCVQMKKPDWPKERQLQGAVAAYNFGCKNVQTWEQLDRGSTNDDYSNDVIARAQHLQKKYGWR